MLCPRSILYFGLVTVLLLMSRNVRATSDCSKKLNICNCYDRLCSCVNIV